MIHSAPHRKYNAFACHSFLKEGCQPPFKDEDVCSRISPSEVSVQRVQQPFQHHVYYPTGAGALHVATQGHYVKKYFVLYYTEHSAYVVGWYYHRLCEIAPQSSEVTDEWLQLWRQDTRLNMSTTVFMARDENGHFIRGKVWLATFGFLRKLEFDIYRAKPQRLFHGNGWLVPSWLLTTPKILPLQFMAPYNLPKFEDVACTTMMLYKKDTKAQSPNQKGTKTLLKRKRYRKRKHDAKCTVRALKMRYLPIAPRTKKICRRNGVELPTAYTIS